MPITLRCRSCEATLGVPGGRREVVKVCPWCGEKDPVQPDPEPAELDEAEVIDEPPPPLKPKPKASPIAEPKSVGEDRLRELVICLMILLVSGALAAVGFFLARYLSL